MVQLDLEYRILFSYSTKTTVYESTYVDTNEKGRLKEKQKNENKKKQTKKKCKTIIIFYINT